MRTPSNERKSIETREPALSTYRGTERGEQREGQSYVNTGVGDRFRGLRKEGGERGVEVGWGWGEKRAASS